MICINEICIVQESCGNCEEDEECLNGECLKKCKDICSKTQRCYDGQCVPLNGNTCPVGEVYNKKYGCHPKISCMDNKHCPSPLWCDETTGQCVNYCKDKNCPQEYKCVENMCLPLEKVKECFHENECTAKTYCDNLLNNCKDYCDKNACEPDEECNDGKCVSNSSCDKCPEYHICSNEKCVRVQCIFPSQCSKGFICRFGRCEPITECKTEFNCPSSYKCVEGSCIKYTKCDPSKCGKNFYCQTFLDISVCIPEISCAQNCPTGMKCVKNKCIPDCNGKLCKLSQHCFQEKCISSGIEKVQCKTKENCPRKHLCIDGTCEEQNCFYDNDCPRPNDVCINYKCLPTKCFSHRDCNTFPYTYCDDSQCIDNRCNDLTLQFVKECIPLKCPCISPYICKFRPQFLNLSEKCIRK